MAEIRRGKNKGKSVTLHQWCNDWFTVDEDFVPGGTVSPTNLVLTESERDMVRESIANGEAGHMDNWFDLNDDGTFSRKPRSLE